jgi:hypothetical protein
MVFCVVVIGLTFPGPICSSNYAKSAADSDEIVYWLLKLE